MTTNAPVTKAYSHLYFGHLNEDKPQSLASISNNFIVDGDTIQIGGDGITEIIIGNGSEGTTTTINSETSIIGNGTTESITTIDTQNTNIGDGEAGSNTTIRSENLSVGRYIYTNSLNEYNDSTMDSGLVANLETLPNLSFNINDVGFTTDTVHVDVSTGFLPNQILAVQSEKNTGLYQCLTHISNVITINTNPDEPFCKSSFNAETANGSVRAINVGVMRYSRDPLGSTEMEVGTGDFVPIDYQPVIYNTRSSAELGSLVLTNASEQIQLGDTLITANGARTHTIPDTADDEFTMNIATQELENKTMTDNTNNVTARGLFFGSGASTVSTYSSTAPVANQFLKATSGSVAGFSTIEMTPGNSILLNNSKSTQNLGTGPVTVTFKANEEQDPDEIQDELSDIPEPTNPDFPGVPSTGVPGLPGIPGLPFPMPVVAGFAGAAVGGAFVGGFGAFGGLGVTGDAQIDGNTTINGDLTVLGTTTTVSTSSISLSSPYIYLNSNYSETAPKKTGMISTRDPESTIYDLSNFVGGDGSNDAQCDISATGLTVGDIIQVYSVDPYSGPNTGYYEVYSLTAGSPNILKVKGQNSHLNVESWTNNNFGTETADLKAVKVAISGLEFSSDAEPYYLKGNNTTTLEKHKIAYDTSSPIFDSLTSSSLTTNFINSGISPLPILLYDDISHAPGKKISTENIETVNLLSVAQDDTTTKILTLNDNALKYHDGTELFTLTADIENVTASAGGATKTIYMNSNYNNHFVVYNLQPFFIEPVEDVPHISFTLTTSKLPYWEYNAPIYMEINDIWEECIFHISGSGSCHIFRKDLSNFPGGTIRYGSMYHGTNRLLLNLVCTRNVF